MVARHPIANRDDCELSIMNVDYRYDQNLDWIVHPVYLSALYENLR